jgi:citrate lyase beta subunit
MSIRRCLLFLSGSKPDRYQSALDSGADLVCLDLEDSVAPDGKADARDGAMALIASGDWHRGRSVLRINHPSTKAGSEDMEALCAMAAGRDAPPLQVMLPKVESTDDLDLVKVRLDVEGIPSALIPVIETARALANVEEIATSGSIAWMQFGGVDMSASLGAAMEWEPLLYARSRIVHAGALGEIGVMDVPFLDLSNADGLEAEAIASKKLGFKGKAAFHPDQVPIVQAVFAPTEAEVQRARGIIEAADGDGRAAFMLNGHMVDKPVVDWARRTLAVAESDEG